MRKILYAMQFKGRVSMAASDSNLLRANSSAASCVLSTSIRREGVRSALEPSEGEMAFLESELRLTGPESFQEGGTITFGEESGNFLRFTTAGEGKLTRGSEPETMAGNATWHVEGGGGQFADARGMISSAFLLTSTGEVDNFHCGLILVPE